uniref:endo-1,4-beta-xylanase n=1 Tax=uncultured bacterium contig00069 TaxID=1181550 RepID=A0A806KIP7_9BACT|nr:endo-1,4-beta-xylanase C precursor [uncultured bacterium contig00069]
MKKFIAALFFATFFCNSLFAQGDCSFPSTQLTNGNELTVTSQWQTTGTVSGTEYEYELWHNANESSNAVSMTIYGANQGGGAAFRGEWNEPDTKFDYLARIGYKFEKSGNGSGKLYTEYGDIFADYRYTRSSRMMGNNYSYIGIYGWARAGNDANLVEYYIVDDWWGNRHQDDNTSVTTSTTGGNEVGTINVDGGSYKVIKSTRQNAPSIEGDNSNFDQYFSVRQSPRKCGTISITEHFREWDRLGLKLGKLYEAKILAEAGAYETYAASSGWIDYSYAHMRVGDLCSNGEFELKVNISPITGGSVNKSPNNICYASGNVNLTATPHTGWKFDGWSGDATGTNASTSVTMNGNKNVTANFSLEADGTNLIKNGDFANTEDWTLNTWENSAGTFSAASNTGTINITTLPTTGDIWDLQLIQAGIPLIKGVTYRLAFDARAASARDISLEVQKHTADWDSYFQKSNIGLTTSNQTFEYEFTMENDSDENARIAFNVGNSDANVFLSNVELVVVSSSSPIRQFSQLSKADFRVSSLNGALRIESKANASIYLYDISGNKVLDFNVPAGESIVRLSLPSGIYIVKNLGNKKAQKVMVK